MKKQNLNWVEHILIKGKIMLDALSNWLTSIVVKLFRLPIPSILSENGVGAKIDRTKTAVKWVKWSSCLSILLFDFFKQKSAFLKWKTRWNEWTSLNGVTLYLKRTVSGQNIAGQSRISRLHSGQFTFSIMKDGSPRRDWRPFLGRYPVF